MGPICSLPPRLTSTVVVVVGGVNGVVGSMLVLSEFFESHLKSFCRSSKGVLESTVKHCKVVLAQFLSTPLRVLPPHTVGSAKAPLLILPIPRRTCVPHNRPRGRDGLRAYKTYPGSNTT